MGAVSRGDQTLFLHSQQHFLAIIPRMTTKVVLVALLCLVGCASASLPDGADPARPDLADLLAQLERNPIGPGEELRITKLVESAEMSGLLVQVRGSLPPHFTSARRKSCT
jgi:hypothetical protein